MSNMIRPCRCDCGQFVFGNETNPIEVDVLLFNIITAAALCRSFKLGRAFPYYFDDECIDDWSDRDYWAPGHNRTAPRWP